MRDSVLPTLTLESHPALWRDYLTLCKPKVVALMLLTSLVGMLLAVSGWVPWGVLLGANMGIGLCAASAAVINHVLDRHIDTRMRRTQQRPVAQARISAQQAIGFALVLMAAGLVSLILWANLLTAVMTFVCLIGYALVYTLWLKHATPQNIVIGGLAGAAPPLLGWCAVTGSLAAEAWLLVLIIFVWTPPHFWCLALYREREYAAANVPMLPVTHGAAYTRLQILLYSILLLLVSLFPVLIGMSGVIYLLAAMLLGAGFFYYVLRLYYEHQRRWAIRGFQFSITYLMGLFCALLLDHYLL